MYVSAPKAQVPTGKVGRSSGRMSTVHRVPVELWRAAMPMDVWTLVGICDEWKDGGMELRCPVVELG